MVGRPLNVGKIFGIRLTVNWSLILLVAAVSLFLAFRSGNILLGALVGVLSLGALFASVLAHELGHSLVAQRLGVRIAEIELHFFGGAAKMTSMPRTARHEILIAGAGPLVSFVLAGLFAVLAWALPTSSLLSSLATINFMLGAFNLLPALPMDGGRILRAFLAQRSGYLRGTEQAITVARVATVGLGVVAIVSGNFFLLGLSVFLWLLGTQELRLARLVQSGYAGLGTNDGADWRQQGPQQIEVYDREGRLIGLAPGGAVTRPPQGTPRGASAFDNGPRVNPQSAPRASSRDYASAPRRVFVRQGSGRVTFVTSS
jgi:Zn-dependent protease